MGTTQPEQKGLSHPTPALPSLVHRCRPSRRSIAQLSTVVQLPSVIVAVDGTGSSPLVTPRTHQNSRVVGLLTCLRTPQTYSDWIVNAPKLSLVVAPLPLNSTVLTTRLHTWSSTPLLTLIQPCHPCWHPVDCAKCYVTRVVKLD